MSRYDLLVLTLGLLMRVLALAGASYRRPVRELLFLKVYLAISIAADITELAIAQEFTKTSTVYFFAYYLSDLAIVVLGYFVLTRFLELVFDRTRLSIKHLRIASILVFSGLATISAFVVLRQLMAAAPEVQFTALVGVHRNTSLAKFETELEQNLSFLGMILTVVLWITMNAMFVPGVRFRRVVLAFSVLYSSGAILYTLEALFGWAAFSRNLLPLTGVATAALFAYTLWTSRGESVSYA